MSVLSQDIETQLRQGRGIPIATSEPGIVDYTVLVARIQELEKDAELGSVVRRMPTGFKLVHTFDGVWALGDNNKLIGYDMAPTPEEAFLNWLRQIDTQKEEA